MKKLKIYVSIILTLSSYASLAQQWGGSSTKTGTIERKGPVIVRSPGTPNSVIGNWSNEVIQVNSTGGANLAIHNNYSSSGHNLVSLGGGPWGSALYILASGTNQEKDFSIFNASDSTPRMTFKPNGNIGVNNNSAKALFQVTDGSFLADGSIGSIPVTGSGTRLMWVPEKGTLCAGKVSGTHWDNLGDYSCAFGLDNEITGNSSITTGRENEVSGSSVGVFGDNNTVEGATGIVGGYENHLGNVQRTSIFGYNNSANGSESFIAGTHNTISSGPATIIGYNSYCSGLFTYTYGHDCVSTGSESMSIGFGAHSTADNAKSFGNIVRAKASNSMVIGSGSGMGYPTSGFLENNISNSIMLGMGSDVPTMTFFESPSSSTWGYVRIGGTGATSPTSALQIEGHGGSSGLRMTNLSGNGTADYVLTVSSNGEVLLVQNCCEAPMMESESNDEIQELKDEISELRDILKKNGLLSSNSTEIEINLSLKAYPNPTQQDINIQYNALNSSFSTIKIHGLNGQIVHEAKVTDSKGEISLNTSNWERGAYIASIVDESNNIETVTFVVK